MKKLSAMDGFLAGVIAMAYIANYNRSSLPLALVCFIVSVACND